MQIFNKISEMEQWSGQFRCQNPAGKIGFVPTMGFLHQGHLSLVEAALKTCTAVVVSIFVNPIQFNNPEDLKNYPRNTQGDIDLLQNFIASQKTQANREASAFILFMPEAAEVYEDGPPELVMDYPRLTSRLCGKSRPGHFSGVLTVVHNLFLWVRPHRAFFGLKDYQQYILIKKMTRDLRLNVEIVPGTLVREPDGLAMSSRNVRLGDKERITALAIPQALFQIRDEFRQGKHLLEKSPARYYKHILRDALADFHVDYASLYDSDTLEELADSDSPSGALVAVAVFVGPVRLIDNLLLENN